jgi:hypothetical protein
MSSLTTVGGVSNQMFAISSKRGLIKKKYRVELRLTWG